MAPSLFNLAMQDIVASARNYEVWGWLCLSEIRRRYRRTLLGPLWMTFSILIFSLVLAFVWSTLWKQDFSTFLPYLLGGLIPWMFFAGCIGESTSLLLSARERVFSGPILIFELCFQLIGRNLIIFLHNLLALAIIAPFCEISWGAHNLLALVGIFFQVLNLCWVVPVLCVLCLRYRDIQQLVIIGLQVVMFVSPIFWPVSALGDREWIAQINPLYHMVYTIRQPLLTDAIEITPYLVVGFLSIIGLVVAVYFCQRYRQKMVFWY